MEQEQEYTLPWIGAGVITKLRILEEKLTIYSPPLLFDYQCSLAYKFLRDFNANAYEEPYHALDSLLNRKINGSQSQGTIQAWTEATSALGIVIHSEAFMEALQNMDIPESVVLTAQAHIASQQGGAPQTQEQAREYLLACFQDILGGLLAILRLFFEATEQDTRRTEFKRLRVRDIIKAELEKQNELSHSGMSHINLMCKKVLYASVPGGQEALEQLATAKRQVKERRTERRRRRLMPY